MTVDALFRQSGVIRTDTLDEMLDVADLLVHQPLPTGGRVAILTNAGGPAVMCADSCEAQGLQVPPLSATTQAKLRAILPPEASVANPVDMLAAATAEQYRLGAGLVAADPNIDAVISIFLPPLATQPEEVARALRTAVDALGVKKPVLAVFMSAQACHRCTPRTAAACPAITHPNRRQGRWPTSHDTRRGGHAQPNDRLTFQTFSGMKRAHS